MAEVSLTNSPLTFVLDLRRKFYQRLQPFVRGQRCVFDEWLFSEEKIFLSKKTLWLGLLLIKKCLIHDDPHLPLPEIHFNPRNRPLFKFILPPHFSIEIVWRLSAFNNLHKFCVLTFYAEQIYAKE